jgi:hypothetical protein
MMRAKRALRGFSDRITNKVLHQIDKLAPASLCGCNKLALPFQIVASSKKTKADTMFNDVKATYLGVHQLFMLVKGNKG